MVAKTYAFLLLFEFEMPSDLNDETIYELGNEVAMSLTSFFTAKRQDMPTCGSLTIMRAEQTNLQKNRN